MTDREAKAVAEALAQVDDQCVICVTAAVARMDIAIPERNWAEEVAAVSYWDAEDLAIHSDEEQAAAMRNGIRIADTSDVEVVGNTDRPRR